MRTDVSVSGQPVLAVVFGDVVTSLRHPPHRIRMAIEKGKYGQKQVTKDFLMPGKESIHVQRDENSKRRKCDTIIHSKIDPGYLQQLISGNVLRKSQFCEPSIFRVQNVACVSASLPGCMRTAGIYPINCKCASGKRVQPWSPLSSDFFHLTLSLHMHIYHVCDTFVLAETVLHY